MSIGSLSLPGLNCERDIRDNVIEQFYFVFRYNDVMMRCWEDKPYNRPMMEAFCAYFEAMFRQEPGEEYEYERQ